MNATENAPEAAQSSEPARNGLRCPACGSGRWRQTQTRKGKRRCRCAGCSKTWAARPEDIGAPGFGCTSPETVATLARMIRRGIVDVATLADVAGVSRTTARKYRARILAATEGNPGC